MKVNIGPYNDRWRSMIYDKYMTNKYGVMWDDNHTTFEKYLEKFDSGLQSFYNATINKFLDKRKAQKIKVRIDGYDIWGMDHTLAHIVTPMLKLLKERKHGAPAVDDEDVPDELKSTSAPKPENDWDTDDNFFKRWDWVLDEMIWAFEQKARTEWESDYYEFEETDDGFMNMKYKRNDVEGRKKHQARMTNGFRLFGRYYEALWD